jgi:tryptophan-rich sensory protein
MALIKCSECGRTVSDKAKACVGCGAPLAAGSKPEATPDRQKVFNLVPEPDRRPPPSRQHLMWRAILSTLAFVAGVVWSSALAGTANRPASVTAGVLIIIGLCGVIVTAIQFPWTRK